MLREWCADRARWLARRNETCGRFWSDVEEWLTSATTWASIRARPHPPHDTEHFDEDPDHHDPMHRRH